MHWAKTSSGSSRLFHHQFMTKTPDLNKPPKHIAKVLYGKHVKALNTK